MTASSISADHLVIGGGPAGSMAAMRLAAAGRRVLLLEREREAHHKVCGEFLSREAVHYLHQGGIDPREFGAAAIDNLRLSSGQRVVAAALPFQALSLSRRALDEALLARAAENGCEVKRGVAVESIAAEGNGWVARLSNGESVHARAVFVATGKHDLRGWPRGEGKQNDLVGFKMHWQQAPAQIVASRGFMDLFLFPGGYGGLSLIENDVSNLCLVVRRSTLRRLGGWPEFLEAILAGNRHLRRFLDGAEPLWSRPLAISPIPYGYVTTQDRGLWCVGDQAAVIPSFTGDGISIALHSGALAAEMFVAGNGVAEFNFTLRAQLRRSMTLATALSRAAVTGLGRTSAILAVSLLPHTMQSIASLTRIPLRSLLRRANTHGEHRPLPPPAGQNASI
jgi:flavin-dependent dehydrogenase